MIAALRGGTTTSSTLRSGLARLFAAPAGRAPTRGPTLVVIPAGEQIGPAAEEPAAARAPITQGEGPEMDERVEQPFGLGHLTDGRGRRTAAGVVAPLVMCPPAPLRRCP